MENKPKSRVGLWIAVVILVLMLGVSMMINVGVVVVGALAGSAARGPVQGRSDVEEVWQFGRGDKKVLHLEISGPIMRSLGGGIFGASTDMVDDLTHKIRVATKDSSVQAIILDVNSPGGAVTPTDEIYNALLEFKNSGQDRRIITFVRDAAVSGSYWLAVAGDSIVAQPTSMIGSIGVIMQSINLSGLSEKLGISGTTIKSGSNKDLLNPWQETREEHVALLQDMIDESHAYFREVILSNRSITPAELDKVADGRVMTSRAALECGLIDKIGYWDDALAEVKSLIGTDRFRLIQYKRRGKGFMQLFASNNIGGIKSLLRNSGPRLMSILEL